MATRTTKATTPKAPALTPYDDLSDEVKAIMDRAVRKARASYWCDRFDENAPAIFGVKDTDVIDSDGLSCRGYDREGYDKEGFNREGWNREERNAKGFDKKGFDTEGYDKNGINKAGVDRQGRDKYRYDSNGYDAEGYDMGGRRRQANREWYAAQAAKPETDFIYDAAWNIRPKKATPAKAAPVKVARQRAGSKLIGY